MTHNHTQRSLSGIGAHELLGRGAGDFPFLSRTAAPSAQAIRAHSFWIPCAAGARGGLGHGRRGGAAPARAGCGRRGRCRGRGRPAPRGGNPSRPHRGGPRGAPGSAGGRGAHGPAPVAGRALSHLGTRPGNSPFPPTPTPAVTDGAIFRPAVVTGTEARAPPRPHAGPPHLVRAAPASPRGPRRIPSPHPGGGPPAHPRGGPPASRPRIPAGGPPASRPRTPQLPRSAPLPAAPRLRLTPP